MRKLTPKQKAYARERAKGKSYAQAYKDAGYSPNGKRETAERHAYALEHESGETSDKIMARIKHYQEQADRGALLDRQARQAMLADLALDEEGSRSDRLKALDLLNKMSGDYSERLQIDANASLTIEEARREAWEALRGKRAED